MQAVGLELREIEDGAFLRGRIIGREDVCQPGAWVVDEEVHRSADAEMASEGVDAMLTIFLQCGDDALTLRA